mmetsp:Transcript_16363/g.53269  ORF Transcript_16363/g.53269 Transcript_16363/m.53269 type:complete len:212 (-) Transcript_16363:44-679(-)
MAFTGALGQAVGTKVSYGLGAGDVPAVERDVFLGLLITVASLALLSLVVYAIPATLGSVFSSDATIIDAFARARTPLAALVFFVNLAVVLERIPVVAGRTKSVLVCATIGSWLGQVPAVILCLTLWQKSIEALFTGVAVGYLFLCLMYAALVASLDFKQIAKEITDDLNHVVTDKQHLLDATTAAAAGTQKYDAAATNPLLAKQQGRPEEP